MRFSWTRGVLAIVALTHLACSAGRAGLGGPDAEAPDLGSGDSFVPPDTGDVDSGATDLGGVDVPVVPDLGTDMPVMPDLGGDLGPPCTPSCSTDGASATTCLGAMETITHCDRGCDPVMRDCRPPVACSYTTYGTITTGAMSIDLCGTGDDRDRIFTAACGIGASGEDVVLRLDVDVMGHYTIDLDDAAGGHGVDPIVYVRTVCDDSSTQLGCDDDGGSSNNASLGIDLGPGEYFLVVDSYDNEVGGTGCGFVDLNVARTP